MNISEKITAYMQDYIRMVTDTGTEKERNNEAFFTQWFQNQPYFRNHPEQWGLYPIAEDSLNRHVPWGLLKGSGNDTIVMIHHSDTVDTDDYGKLAHLATDPQALMEHYRTSTVKLDNASQRDLESGEWLFGRGVCDMKGGAAIHLALLEAYSKQPDFRGNLVMIAVPDEENLSAGMRGAVSLLKELKEKFQLNYVLMLNVEPHERVKDEEGLLYQGAVGKLMPVVYVRGKLTHVGQLYEGLNPINLLAEIIRRTEVNPAYIESVGNTTTFPPTWLYAKDQKRVYDVSLPMAAAGYMNLLTLNRSPGEIFEQLREVATEAFRQIILELNNSFSQYLEMSGQQLPPLEWTPKVKLYGEMAAEAMRDSGNVYQEALQDVMKEIKQAIASNEMTLIDGAYKIIETALAYVHDPSPVVVIALAPPYYPNVHNNMVPEKAARVNQAIDTIRQYALQEWNQPYFVKDYFTGICDLSYAMFQTDDQNIAYIEENMLMWKEVYYIPLETIRELSVPVLNLGPWGKDFHKKTERVYLPDLLERTPILIDQLIREMLDDTKR
ncbi:MAG: M20/M25/M40 family metallo-hydrolase [Bacillota bacterium]|nr:M20/M25/M40 family metallo-hydrolase [Bacillota bacterium]MDW7676320.1 M20/M25/M40 family metallo-hydrolase [Bacillota bacterium]